MKSIYDVPLDSAEGTPNFLEQFKGKVSLIVNTTVGCGNANQLEVLQWLQDKYGGDDFQVIAVPTNDYCGPGVTKGKWADGITCGLDSKLYGEDVYNVTFKYSQMVSSNPNKLVGPLLGQPEGHNGLGQPNGEPHELYKEIAKQILAVGSAAPKLEINYKSQWLNQGFYSGEFMGGNFEKYLVDKDGYVSKHFACTTLNYDIEKTLKESEIQEKGFAPGMGEGRSKEVFEEEYRVISEFIEELISGKKSEINPEYTNA